ncbi:MAG: hypothetical protein H7067_07515 [Burkholderiales bacterium]|nr:hypothetical protein [Opitutaceae bacterium]
MRLASWPLALQGPDGLWSVYVEEPDTGADTSGSAGIAAGQALGHRLGLLPVEALEYFI